MKLINIIVLIILVICSACSSTKTVKIEKKPLISDHYLMMSLLNRPMTGDQKLMLAFAKQQEQYFDNSSPIFVNAVMIKGDKNEQPSQSTHSNNNGIYSSLIAQDINAIRVSGPF